MRRDTLRVRSGAVCLGWVGARLRTIKYDQYVRACGHVYEGR